MEHLTRGSKLRNFHLHTELLHVSRGCGVVLPQSFMLGLRFQLFCPRDTQSLFLKGHSRSLYRTLMQASALGGGKRQHSSWWHWEAPAAQRCQRECASWRSCARYWLHPDRSIRRGQHSHHLAYPTQWGSSQPTTLPRLLGTWLGSAPTLVGQIQRASRHSILVWPVSSSKISGNLFDQTILSSKLKARSLQAHVLP